MDLRIMKSEKTDGDPDDGSQEMGGTDVTEPKTAFSKSKVGVAKATKQSVLQENKVQETKTFHGGKHYPAVNLYLTKNSGQYFKSRQVAVVPFTCEECGGDFESISDLVLHFRTHFNGSHYECSVCRTPFSSNQTLKKHMERHVGKEGRTSVKEEQESKVPEDDGNTDEDGDSLKKEAEKETFSCEFCGKSFQELSALEDHSKEHQNQDLYTCEECGRCYQQMQMLDNHIKMHHVELWNCDECGKAFENKKRLLAHLEVHSGNEVEKRHKCEECGKAFVARSKLIRHMRVHTGERPFRCDVCGRGFNDRSNLFIHARVHTGEKPYTCSLCGKCFTGKNDLNRHQMIHSGVKPHTCKQCGKAFREKSKLNRHVKTHNMSSFCEKPHVCSSCGKGFREKSKLRRHLKIHERETK